MNIERLSPLIYVYEEDKMPTNEEIKKEYQDESKGIYHSFNTTRVIDDMLDKAKAEGYKEGQADTAKQIFKKFEDKVIFIRGNNEDIGIFLSSAKNYFALKKEYKIEE